jgi:hypothetical protein
MFPNIKLVKELFVKIIFIYKGLDFFNKKSPPLCGGVLKISP